MVGRFRRPVAGSGAAARGRATSSRLEHGGIAPLFRRQIGEVDRQGPDRANHVHPVPQLGHMGELPIEIEPFRLKVQESGRSLLAPVIVAAIGFAAHTRVDAAALQLLEKPPRPPMKMRVDDVHR